jgi:hypothetical protein
MAKWCREALRGLRSRAEKKSARGGNQVRLRTGGDEVTIYSIYSPIPNQTLTQYLAVSR